MRRLLCVALAAAAATACNDVSEARPGTTFDFYRPMGIGVFAGKLVVASSNADLLYDSATGGSVISVDPAAGADPARPSRTGGINIESFAGELAIADPASARDRDERCPVAVPAGTALALVAVRGADALYQVGLGADAAPSCGDGCVLSLAGTGNFADTYAVGLACAEQPAPLARAYVGHLRGRDALAWMTEIDLLTGTVRSNAFGAGQIRGFAFDAARRRLYAAQAGAGIRWVDVANGCALDAEELDGGCHPGLATLPVGFEARAIALGRRLDDGPRRLYVLARVVDGGAAAAWGVRAGDVDAVLLVTDLVENLQGGIDVRIVKPPISVGYGPAAVAILPSRGAGRRDVVAALTSDDPVLLLFDDESDAQVFVGRDPATGAPWLGHEPIGLTVDPAAFAGAAGETAAVYVGSYREDYVTRLEVPLGDVEQTQVPPTGGFRRIHGGR